MDDVLSSLYGVLGLDDGDLRDGYEKAARTQEQVSRAVRMLGELRMRINREHDQLISCLSLCDPDVQRQIRSAAKRQDSALRIARDHVRTTFGERILEKAERELHLR